MGHNGAHVAPSGSVPAPTYVEKYMNPYTGKFNEMAWNNTPLAGLKMGSHVSPNDPRAQQASPMDQNPQNLMEYMQMMAGDKKDSLMGKKDKVMQIMRMLIPG